jgi:excisionase family DNA binding protein
MANLMQQQLLTVKDVAEATGLSTSYIYKLVEARGIPHHRIGSRVRFAEGDLQSWLLESKVCVGGAL